MDQVDVTGHSSPKIVELILAAARSPPPGVCENPFVTIEIRPDDLSGDATRTLIAAHVAGMHEASPPESVFALEVDRLRDPALSFWSAWADDELAGIGALKTLDHLQGELKSMRVDDRFRGTGVGRAILQHLIAEARTRGMTSLWLETGSPAAFVPAQRLYESQGFVRCGPFGDYPDNPFSVFMTRAV